MDADYEEPGPPPKPQWVAVAEKEWSKPGSVAKARINLDVRSPLRSGANMVAVVTITNESSKPLSLPLPAGEPGLLVFRIVKDGPVQGGETVPVWWQKAVGSFEVGPYKKGAIEREVATQPLVLKPGASWKDEVHVRIEDEIKGPLRFRVQVGLRFPKGWLKSSEVNAQISPFSGDFLRIGYGAPVMGRASGRGCFIDSGRKTSALYIFNYRDGYERRLGAESILSKADLKPEATDPIVPIRNAGFFSEMLSFVIYREGSEVVVHSDIGEENRVQLPETPATLIKPAVWPKDEQVEVLALSNDRRHVRLVRVSAPNNAAKSWPVGKIVWTKESSFSVVTGVLALGPSASERSSHSMRAFALLGNQGTELRAEIFLYSGQDKSPRSFRQLTLPGAKIVSEAEPALSLSADGRLLFAIVVEKDGRYQIHEWDVPAKGEVKKSQPVVFARAISSGEPGQGTFALKDSRSVKLTGARILYVSDEEGTPKKRYVAAAFSDQSLIGHKVDLDASKQPSPLVLVRKDWAVPKAFDLTPGDETFASVYGLFPNGLIEVQF